MIRRSVALVTSDWLRVALMIVALAVIGWILAAAIVITTRSRTRVREQLPLT